MKLYWEEIIKSKWVNNSGRMWHSKGGRAEKEEIDQKEGNKKGRTKKEERA